MLDVSVIIDTNGRPRPGRDALFTRAMILEAAKEVGATVQSRPGSLKVHMPSGTASDLEGALKKRGGDHYDVQMNAEVSELTVRQIGHAHDVRPQQG